MTASASVVVSQQQNRLLWRSYLASFQQQGGSAGAGAPAPATLAFVLVSTVAIANHLFSRSRLEEEGKGSSSSSTNNDDPSFQIEIDFMDKLSNKSYLRLYNNNSSNTTTTRGNNERPMNVPNSLRLLSVDLPELRRGFRSVDNNNNKSGSSRSLSQQSWCSQVSNRVYTDGVASPKLVQVKLKQKKQHEEEEEGTAEEEEASTGDDDPKKTKKRQPPARRGRRKNKKKDSSSNNAIEIEVDQKVWVQSMYECYTSTKGFNNPSIQIVEANTRTLNPRQLRRTYPFTAAAAANESSSKDNKDNEELVVSSLLEDEVDAPWNQYAWLEEMELRISGNVPFGDPLEPANWYNKWFFGHVYNRCSSSDDDRKRRSWWSTLIPTSYKYQQQLRDSNKPHAVIANRTQMQYVPHALRRLQTMCRIHDVPLFVIDEGKNNNDLGDVLRQVRSSVKERIVLQSLQESSAWAYNWGRYVGQMETEAKLRSQQLSRQVTQVLMRSSSSGNRRNKHKVESWSMYSATELESELAKRGVHIIDANTDAAGSDSASSKNKKGRSCNEALVALSRRCLAAAADEEGQKQNQGEESGGEKKEKIGTTVTPTTTTTTA